MGKVEENKGRAGWGWVGLGGCVDKKALSSVHGP